MQKLTPEVIKQLNNLGGGFPPAPSSATNDPQNDEQWILGDWIFECRVRPGVQLAANLPLVDNVTGDVRFVIAEGAWYWWNGAAWALVVGDGTVDSVTASAPLSSSGGQNPNISLTGVVPAANGGTGLAVSGALGNVLTSNGAGGWVSSAASSTPPGAPLNSVQFNNGGAFGGSAGLTWNGSTLAVDGAVDRATAGTLTVGGTTANAITIGKAGVTTTFPGPVALNGTVTSVTQTTFVTDAVFQGNITLGNDAGDNVSIGGQINTAITQEGIAAPAVSPASTGRIYFDSTSNKFRASQNGGAYVDLISGGTVTSVTATSPIVSSGGTTPNLTLSTVPVGSGGTGATTLAANNVLLGNGGSALQTVAPGSSGNVLTSNGTTWSSSALPASVTSVGASAPLSSSGGTTPSISLTGTVPVGNGGTGTAIAPTNGQIPIGNSLGGYTISGIGAGSNISISNGSGSITISATGVPTVVGNVNQLAYFNGTSSLTSPPGIGVSSLLWDSTNNRLAIGNPTLPLTKRLEVLGDDALIHDVTIGRGGGAVVSNTAIGNSALAAATASATENTAIGRRALLALTTTNSCTAVGHEALGSAVTQPGSTAVGRSALGALTSGDKNTAVGFFAGGIFLTTASNNSYFGFLAGQRISGANNTGIGQGALASGLGGAASSNTAVGAQALGSLTTGADNIAIGRDAGFNLITGAQNTAVGNNALGQSTSGGNNVAIGFSALIADTVGSNSVAIGFRALDVQNPASATVMNNVAVGSNSGGALTTGTSNTLIGAESGNSITTGLDNVVIGHDADLSVNTDQNSIVIGKSAVGFGGNSVSIGSTLVSTFRFAGAAGGLGTGFSGSALNGSTQINIGHASAATALNFMVFAGGGGARGLISGNGAGGVNYTSISDYRLKSEIQAIENPVDRLLLLHPCSFRMTGATSEAKRVEGFIAHEVQAVVPEAVNGTKDAVDAEGTPQYQSLDQSRLVPLLTAACQALATKAQAAEDRIAALEAALAALQR